MDRKETWQEDAKLELLMTVFVPILKELLEENLISKNEYEILSYCLIVFPERNLGRAAKENNVEKKWLEEKIIWVSKEIKKRVAEVYSKKERFDSMQENLSYVEIMKTSMFFEPIFGSISHTEMKFLQKNFRNSPSLFEVISFVPNKKDHGGKSTKRRESFQEKYSAIVSKIFTAIVKKQKAS